MGETIRPGTKIRDFCPDDTDTKIYKDASSWSYSLADLQRIVQEKWPDAEPMDIQLSADHIHTNALGYPRYDPTDYTTFIVIEHKPVPEQFRSFHEQGKKQEVET